MIFSLFGQNNKSDYTVMFYNVENLFDTINDPNVEDEDFLPEGPKKWKSKRYFKKINDIARVIASTGKNLPAVIGLCEIENKTVLRDLVKTDTLAQGKYQIIQEDSKYHRGMDVALLYKPSVFEYIKHLAIPVKFNDGQYSRDILHVILKDKKTNKNIHFFVNHWKSKRGNKEETALKRKFTAELLRKEIDAVLKEDENALILAMGDFNDTPKSKSIKNVLKASQNIPEKTESLHNAVAHHIEKGKGTHNYRGTWSVLDQIIISKGFLNETSLNYIKPNSGEIYGPDKILYIKKDKSKTPNKTYGGNNYYGGYSDHLPVYIKIYQK